MSSSCSLEWCLHGPVECHSKAPPLFCCCFVGRPIAGMQHPAPASRRSAIITLLLLHYMQNFILYVIVDVTRSWTVVAMTVGKPCSVLYQAYTRQAAVPLPGREMARLPQVMQLLRQGHPCCPTHSVLLMAQREGRRSHCCCRTQDTAAGSGALQDDFIFL